MPELTVTSEIYEEYDYRTKITPTTEGSKCNPVLYHFYSSLSSQGQNL